jgi:hypothetical protein
VRREKDNGQGPARLQSAAQSQTISIRQTDIQKGKVWWELANDGERLAVAAGAAHFIPGLFQTESHRFNQKRIVIDKEDSMSHNL